MELIRGAHNLEARHRGCVATIGNYDGLHLGHAQVLRRLVERARDDGLPSLVMVFEPTPLEFFSGEQAPEQFIRSLLVEGIGVRHLVVGDDFRFGRDRSGDFSTLEVAGRSQGFDVVDTPSYSVDGIRVSSTLIREALAGRPRTGADVGDLVGNWDIRRPTCA